MTDITQHQIQVQQDIIAEAIADIAEQKRAANEPQKRLEDAQQRTLDLQQHAKNAHLSRGLDEIKAMREVQRTTMSDLYVCLDRFDVGGAAKLIVELDAQWERHLNILRAVLFDGRPAGSSGGNHIKNAAVVVSGGFALMHYVAHGTMHNRHVRAGLVYAADHARQAGQDPMTSLALSNSNYDMVAHAAKARKRRLLITWR